jgi:hypothetical protein
LQTPRLSSIGFDSIHSTRIVAPSFSNTHPGNKNKKKGKEEVSLVLRHHSPTTPNKETKRREKKHNKNYIELSMKRAFGFSTQLSEYL